MALADCAVTIFADVCKQSKIEFSKLDAVVEAEKPAASPILTGVTIRTKVRATARKELLEAAWRRTEANCPVLSLFKEPIPLKVEFKEFLNSQCTGFLLKLGKEVIVCFLLPLTRIQLQNAPC
jgi:uncharacterized OsmC-like protein